MTRGRIKSKLNPQLILMAFTPRGFSDIEDFGLKLLTAVSNVTKDALQQCCILPRKCQISFRFIFSSLPLQYWPAREIPR